MTTAMSRLSRSMQSSAAAVELRGVTCRFAGSGGGVYTAVSDVDLRIEDGEFVSVVGPTGCGKSTLLNVAAGLLEPSEGEISVYGAPADRDQSPGRLPVSGRGADAVAHRAGQRRRRACGFRGVPRRGGATAQARDWLARVGSTCGHAARYPIELSGGMRKRVALAQALILDPRVAADGRAVQRAGRADAGADGGRAAPASGPRTTASRCCSSRTTWRRRSRWPIGWSMLAAGAGHAAGRGVRDRPAAARATCRRSG